MSLVQVAFEMARPQTYRVEVLMLDGWKAQLVTLHER
jgi:hypothetical protein